MAKLLPLVLLGGAALVLAGRKKKKAPTPDASDCLEGLFSEEPIPLRQDILGELSPEARGIASGHTYHMTPDGQAQVFMAMTRAATEGAMIPTMRTLKVVAPECDWENPNERMSAFEESVLLLYDAVKKDMEG